MYLCAEYRHVGFIENHSRPGLHPEGEGVKKNFKRERELKGIFAAAYLAVTIDE